VTPSPLMTNTKLYKRKLYGWLSYAFARSASCSVRLQLSYTRHSEVFVIVSLTLFLPICLEQFARDNGRLLPDRTEPCSSLQSEGSPQRCSVKIGLFWIDTASFRCVSPSVNRSLFAYLRAVYMCIQSRSLCKL
jgi:MFS transporter, UMF1 family